MVTLTSWRCPVRDVLTAVPTLTLSLAAMPVQALAAESGNPFVLPQPAWDVIGWIVGLVLLVGVGGGLGILAAAIIMTVGNRLFGDGDDEALWQGTAVGIVLAVFILAGAAGGLYVFVIW